MAKGTTGRYTLSYKLVVISPGPVTLLKITQQPGHELEVWCAGFYWDFPEVSLKGICLVPSKGMCVGLRRSCWKALLFLCASATEDLTSERAVRDTLFLRWWLTPFSANKGHFTHVMLFSKHYLAQRSSSVFLRNACPVWSMPPYCQGQQPNRLISTPVQS